MIISLNNIEFEFSWIKNSEKWDYYIKSKENKNNYFETNVCREDESDIIFLLDVIKEWNIYYLPPCVINLILKNKDLCYQYTLINKIEKINTLFSISSNYDQSSNLFLLVDTLCYTNDDDIAYWFFELNDKLNSYFTESNFIDQNFYTCVVQNNFKMLKFLQIKCGFISNSALLACSDSGNLQLLKYCIRKNMKPFDRLFSIASENGHLKIMKYLKRNYSISNDSYNMSIISALCSNNLIILNWFEKNKISIDQEYIQYTIINGCYEAFKWMLNYFPELEINKSWISNSICGKSYNIILYILDKYELIHSDLAELLIDMPILNLSLLENNSLELLLSRGLIIKRENLHMFLSTISISNIQILFENKNYKLIDEDESKIIIQNHRIDLIKFFINLGYKPSKNDILNAIELGYCDFLDLFNSNEYKNMEEFSIEAVYNNKLLCLKWLIDNDYIISNKITYKGLNTDKNKLYELINSYLIK